jgi:hypothetical protein
MISKLLAANVSRAKVMAIRSFRAPERHQELRGGERSRHAAFPELQAGPTGFVEPKKAVLRAKVYQQDELSRVNKVHGVFSA